MRGANKDNKPETNVGLSRFNAARATDGKGRTGWCRPSSLVGVATREGSREVVGGRSDLAFGRVNGPADNVPNKQMPSKMMNDVECLCE